MEDYDEVQMFMNYLEEEGVLEWVGMSEGGERAFVFNFEKMLEVFPELYYAMIEEMNNELLELYKLGFVSIEYNSNLEAGFKITEEGKKYLKDNGIPVPEEFE